MSNPLAEEKDYPIGKNEERLQAVSPTAVGWRVSLTCDKFPVDLRGELARVTVYHLRGGEYVPIRSVSLSLNRGRLKGKDGADAAQWWIGGEYPFELNGLDKNRQPTKDSYDKDGKPIYNYLKPEEFKIEIDSKFEFRSQVTIEEVERGALRGRLGILPEQLQNGGS